MRYCLDTSAYIQFRRGDPAISAAIDQATWIGFPTIALGELFTGLELRGHPRNDLEHLHGFLSHPVVEVVPVDDEAARQYGPIVAELRAAGTPLPANDIWIAACAARTSSIVLTCDAHFTRIARVGCQVMSRGGRRRP